MTVGSEQETLFARLREGDQSAWSAFFEKYDPVIISIVSWNKWRFSPVARDEVAQAVRTALVKALPAYDQRSSFDYFLKQICIHHCIDEVRRQVRANQRLVPLFSEDECPPINPDSPPNTFNPVREIILKERADMLRGLLDKLQGKCQDIIQRFYLMGQSYDCIGDNLGVSVNTVGSRLARCLERLRKSAGALKPAN